MKIYVHASWCKLRHHVELGTFDLTPIVLSDMDTGADICNARSALWINPSLCTVSSAHIKMHQHVHLRVWWYLSFFNPCLHRKRPRQHLSAAKHKFFQLHTTNSLKSCRKKEPQRRKTSAWCMILLCHGRWQMIKFNLLWCSLWFGLVWLVIWKCKKVNACEDMLFFFRFFQRILDSPNPTLLLLLFLFLCRPWAVWQRKRHALLGHSNVHGESDYCVELPFCCVSATSANVVHSCYDCILSFLRRMTQPPPSNKSIVPNQF